MPTRGNPRRAFRLEDDDQWERFGKATEALGSDRSEVLRDFVDWFVDQPDRVTYKRRKPPRRRSSPDSH